MAWYRGKVHTLDAKLLSLSFDYWYSHTKRSHEFHPYQYRDMLETLDAKYYLSSLLIDYAYEVETIRSLQFSLSNNLSSISLAFLPSFLPPYLPLSLTSRHLLVPLPYRHYVRSSCEAEKEREIQQWNLR